METTATTETTTARQRADGWTPARQRQFIEALAETGSVEQSAEQAKISPQAAYAYRHRAAGGAFKIGWDAAILVARTRLADSLLHRAIHGQTDILERDETGHRVERTRTDNRLGMSMLTRLDRMSERVEEPGHAMLVDIVAQDFEAFLDLLENGGGPAAAALFCAARKEVNILGIFMDRLAGMGDNGQSQLSDLGEEECGPFEPEEGSVWRDSDDEWVTNFAPPPDFFGEEEGRFGEDGYQRALSEDEQEAQDAMEEARMAPTVAESSKLRDSYFGFIPELLQIAKAKESGYIPEDFRANDNFASAWDAAETKKRSTRAEPRVRAL